MKRTALILFAVCCLAVCFVAAQEKGSHPSAVSGTPQWEKLKSLVGEWDGYMAQGEQKVPTHISVRLTGDGSALMHWMAAGTPYEMITMFHMDKTDLLATHYCAAHNQPRLKAVPSQEAASVTFEFKDGTNIRPGDVYMRRVVITYVDGDHHNEIWSSDNNGKLENGTFYLTRVKQPAKKQ